MIEFERFTIEDGTPIYLQIILYLKRGAVAGIVRDGDELPSRRVLSALLGVNPNTIQKAYRMLEDEGMIVSHAGAKSYVLLTPARLSAIREELLASDARTLIAAMRQMGLDRTEALALIDKYWEES